MTDHAIHSSFHQLTHSTLHSSEKIIKQFYLLKKVILISTRVFRKRERERNRIDGNKLTTKPRRCLGHFQRRVNRKVPVCLRGAPRERDVTPVKTPS